MCNTASRKINGVKRCRAQLAYTDSDPSIEHDIEDIIGLADELDKNSKISLNQVKVEGSRLAIEYRLSDLKVRMKSASLMIKGVFGISKQLFQALFIYFIYTIFRDAVKMIRKYRDDVDFSNCYITKEFWLIDKHREELGQTHISRITKQEKTKLKIMGIFKFPTGMERKSAIRPFFKWFCLMITVVILVIIDHFLYSFLDSVIESSVTQVKQKGGPPMGITVTGDGIVAEFMRTMSVMNETLEIDRTLSNEHCLTKPTRPNVTLLVCWLILPLVFSFVFQVIFSFAIRRLIINFFFPFMFPRRSRTRLVHFYNKLLMNREKNRKEARARVRFLTDRRKVQTQQSNNFLTAGTFLRTQIFERIFKTGKCFLCQEKLYARKLKYCVNISCIYSQSSFCNDCIEDNFGKCYACMVTRKEVTDEKSKLLAPSEAGKEDEFVDYPKFLTLINKIDENMQIGKKNKKKNKKKTSVSTESGTTTTKKGTSKNSSSLEKEI
ncbi:unnamed protein product [Caenorhabditis angaria]|uniref:Dendritic cell-specific transmembrane protein-like domain-containing protein n=1 Tax=Caenorhabditis angaria TaxID=860376 RepID=A0A9P1IUU1_9PELO|nr:unnamed protein product [Caenorhabditis angaria]